MLPSRPAAVAPSARPSAAVVRTSEPALPFTDESPAPEPSPLSGFTGGAGTGLLLALGAPSSLPGGSARVHGASCPPGSTVQLTVDDVAAGTSNARQDGSFDAVLKVPDLAVGRHVAKARCGDRVVSANLDLVVATSATGTTPALAAVAGIVLVFFVLLAGLVIPTGDAGPRRRPDLDTDDEADALD